MSETNDALTPGERAHVLAFLETVKGAANRLVAKCAVKGNDEAAMMAAELCTQAEAQRRLLCGEPVPDPADWVDDDPDYDLSALATAAPSNREE